jgi:hypothetical protein
MGNQRDLRNGVLDAGTSSPTYVSPSSRSAGAPQSTARNATFPLQDAIASTTVWYQTEPHAPFPALPDANALEVV